MSRGGAHDRGRCHASFFSAPEHADPSALFGRTNAVSSLLATMPVVTEIKAARRAYSDRVYRSARAAMLAANPVCHEPGCGRPARVADHWPPLKAHEHKTGGGCFCVLLPHCWKHFECAGRPASLEEDGRYVDAGCRRDGRRRREPGTGGFPG